MKLNAIPYLDEQQSEQFWTELRSHETCGNCGDELVNNECPTCWGPGGAERPSMFAEMFDIALPSLMHRQAD